MANKHKEYVDGVLSTIEGDNNVKWLLETVARFAYDTNWSFDFHSRPGIGFIDELIFGEESQNALEMANVAEEFFGEDDDIYVHLLQAADEWELHNVNSDKYIEITEEDMRNMHYLYESAWRELSKRFVVKTAAIW